LPVAILPGRIRDSGGAQPVGGGDRQGLQRAPQCLGAELQPVQVPYQGQDMDGIRAHTAARAQESEFGQPLQQSVQHHLFPAVIDQAFAEAGQDAEVEAFVLQLQPEQHGPWPQGSRKQAQEVGTPRRTLLTSPRTDQSTHHLSPKPARQPIPTESRDRVLHAAATQTPNKLSPSTGSNDHHEPGQRSKTPEPCTSLKVFASVHCPDGRTRVVRSTSGRCRMGHTRPPAGQRGRETCDATLDP
jgi:hypothetical protein